MSNQHREPTPMASALANSASHAAVAFSVAVVLIGAGTLARLIGAAVLGYSQVVELYVAGAVILAVGIAALVAARRFRRAHDRAVAAYRDEASA